ncbi:Imh1p KNAG_0I02960 [Huiozyma naganishii CBS 8797]|uniref:GRIP domain-containing protein n=1 Tax=Huiozyma naganishii (strain ATCC MYA-139 / BCRC 22969 / CBS 8797 / KCTC 17520 / NBRC 10181 / NCYC 3082 / Yp74L-3) TaxID=1071383 RepID=J7RB28_HUIN7|nr:hypothetical protein KNAG_0I02960 [Kazachstania naganishii CBS 8797]CCK72080.1 hypothetical protein KNAG_0I02960 [Kazachstania naganishii CBS 8797]
MFKQLSQIGKNLTDEIQKGLSDEQLADGVGNGTEPSTGNSDDPVKYEEFPKEIQGKLRKLDKYESKYPLLLNAYKSERVKNEKFEAVQKILMENTPISDFNDVEQTLSVFFTDLTNKTSMLNEEIKRLTIAKQKTEEENKQLKQENKDKLPENLSQTEKEAEGGTPFEGSTDDSELQTIFETQKRQITDLQTEIKDLKEKYEIEEKSREEAELAKKVLEDDEKQYGTDITKIKTELQQVSEKNDSAEKTIKTLEEQLKHVEETATEDKKLLNSKDVLLKENEDQMRKLEGEIQEKKQKIATLQKDVESLKVTVSQNGSNVDMPSLSASKKKKNKKKGKKNGPTTDNISVEAAQDVNSASIDESTAAASRYDDLLNKYNTLETLHGNCEDWKVKYTKLETDSESKCKEIELQLESLQKALELIKEEKVEARRELEFKNKELEEVRDMLKTVGNELVEARDSIKEAGVNSTDKLKLEAEITALKEKISMYEEKEPKLNETIKKLRQTEEDLKRKHNDEKAALESNVKFLTSTLEEKKKENDILSTQLKDYNSLKSSLLQKEKTVVYLEKQVREFTTNDEAVKRKLETLKKDNEKLNNRIELLKKENESLTAEVKKNSGSYEGYLKENGKLCERLNVLQEKYNTLQNLKSNSNEQTNSIKRQCEELNLKLKEANKRIMSMEDELNEYSTIIHDKTREADTMRRLLSESQNEGTDKQESLQTKLSFALEEKAKLESDMALQSSRQIRETQELKRSQNELETEMHKLKMKEKQMLLEIETLTSLNEAIKRKNEVNSEDSSGLEKIASNLKESLSRADKRVQELQKSNEELLDLNNDINKKFDRLTKNYKSLSNQFNAFKDVRQDTSRRSSRSGSVNSQASDHKLPSKSLSVPEQVARRSSSFKDVPSILSSTGKPKDADIEREEKVAYIKNVLLGFLEHKDQRNQLLPVISMLLHFDSNDERRLLMSLR